MRTYRHTATARVFNRVVTWLIRLRVPMGPRALLTVPGRKTGLPRTTPVAVVRSGESWQLMAPYGAVDWVKNLRAAGTATLTHRGRRTAVTAVELPPAQAAPVLRDNLSAAGPIVWRVLSRYFDVGRDAPLEAWRAEADRHPVFILRPAH